MSGDRVLSPDEFAAQLAGTSTKDISAVLSPEDFAAALQDVTPGKPGVLRSLATGAIEGAAAGMDMADALARNALGADEAFRVKTNSDAYYLDLPPEPEAGPNIFTDAASALRQTAAGLTPPEQVGRGNMFTEGLPKLGGQVLPGVALGAANPAAGAAYFGAQAGPTYFEILDEGGSPDQAMVGMIGNAALMQLERVGVGGALTRALKRVGATKLGEATLGKIGAYVAAGGAKEVGTEVLEQIGHDLILAGMTDAEVNILDNAIATAKTPELWLLGKMGAGAELATRRGAQTAPAAPGAGQATPMTAQRPTEPIAPQRAPIAPGAVQQPQAPAGPALPPAEVPMLGEGGERGLVPAPRQIGPGETQAPAQAEPLALPAQQPEVVAQQALTADPEPQPSGIPGELPAPDPVGSEPVRAEEPVAAPAAETPPAAPAPTGDSPGTRLEASRKALSDEFNEAATLGFKGTMSARHLGPRAEIYAPSEGLIAAIRSGKASRGGGSTFELGGRTYTAKVDGRLVRIFHGRDSSGPAISAFDYHDVAIKPKVSAVSSEPVATLAEQPAPSAEVPTPPAQEPAKFTPPETAPEVKPPTPKKSTKAAAAAYMKASNEHAKYVEKSVEPAKDRLRRLEKEQGIFEANAKDTDRRRFFDVYGFKSEADVAERRAQLEAEIKAAKFDLGEANTRASELLAKREKADADWKAVEPPKAAKTPVSDDPEAKSPTRAWDDDYADAKEIANGDTPEWASPRAKAWGEKLSEFYDQGKSEGAWKRTLPKRPKAGAAPEAPKKKAPDYGAYRGYLVKKASTSGPQDTFIEKDGRLIGWAKDVEDAHRIINELAPKKPSGGATEMFAGGPNPFGKFSNVSTSKFKKWAKKWLSSPGHRTRDVRLEMEFAENAPDAEMIEGGRYAKQLDAALRKVDPNWRATETAEQVDDAFEGDEAALRALPAEAQAAIADMRAHLDRLIRSQVKKGGVIDPEKMPEFAKKILESQGSYARRQYKAYLDPEWADKVPADVRDRLFRLWQSWAQDMDPADMIDLRRSARQRTSEGEAAFKRRRQLSNEISKLKRGDPRRAELVKERASLRLTAKKYTAEAQAARTEIAGRKAFKGKSDEDIQAEMDATLQAAKEKTQNPFKDIASGKLGRKDLSVYKRRKAIPAELRAFLGEVKDPIANYATSVFKIAQNVARHEASVNIRKMGLGKFLFEKPTGDAVAKLTAEGNRSLAPLDGLYVTPELKAALVQLESSALPVWLKLVARANSAIKWGKVIGQPWAFMRNLWGNVPMSIANGHLPAYFNSKEWDAAFGKGDLETLKRLKRLGIVGDNISTVEWDDAKRAAKATPEEIAKGALEPGVLGKAKQFAETAFSAADNAPKIRFFFAEEAALREAGYSAKEAERIAADRTRDLMPTPERMAEALKQFRKQPLLGTFFSFRAEVIRTTANRIKLISEELKSENPKVRAMGQRRAVGQIVAATLTPALAYTWNMISGVDSDEDEDKRNFLAPWDKNSRIVWFGEETKGEYFDLSDLDPFTMGSDPAMRVLAGADPEEAIKGLVREELEAFVGPSMVTQLALDIYRREKRDGTPIDDMGAHILKQIQPGFVAAARRAPETGVLAEAGSIVSGVRRYQFDVEKSLSFDSARYKRIQSQAKEKQGRQARKDPEGLKGYTEELEMTREEAFDEMARKAQAALRLGVTPREVRKILSESLSTAEASAIISGKYRPHKESRKALAP